MATAGWDSLVCQKVRVSVIQQEEAVTQSRFGLWARFDFSTLTISTCRGSSWVVRGEGTENWIFLLASPSASRSISGGNSGSTHVTAGLTDVRVQKQTNKRKKSPEGVTFDRIDVRKLRSVAIQMDLFSQMKREVTGVHLPHRSSWVASDCSASLSRLCLHPSLPLNSVHDCARSLLRNAEASTCYSIYQKQKGSPERWFVAENKILYHLTNICPKVPFDLVQKNKRIGDFPF